MSLAFSWLAIKPSRLPLPTKLSPARRERTPSPDWASLSVGGHLKVPYCLWLIPFSGFGFLLTPIISKLATLFLGQRGPLIVGGWICLMTLPLLLLIKDKNVRIVIVNRQMITIVNSNITGH